MSHARWGLLFALTLLGAGCGDDAPATPDAGDELDAEMPECTSNANCDDGDPCNGEEVCDEGVCLSPRTPSPNGTACVLDDDDTTREICISGVCSAARCGDGYVDTAVGEQCDDGNGIDGDGCDDCRYSCVRDEDCDDGEECNGQESCSPSHRCERSDALEDGTSCGEGVGSCVEQACLPNSCTEDADCNDGNVCNGLETCDPEIGCVRGAPLVCDDESACTADRCDPARGCLHTLLDEDFDGHASSSLGECGTDCDDRQASVNPDASDVCDGLDNDCDGSIDEGGVAVWYADCDGDGYAAGDARSVESCAQPAASMTGCGPRGSWTTRAPVRGAIDCNDGNPAVNPGQTEFQTTAVTGGGFDYDCNGVDEARTTVHGGCSLRVLRCEHTEGWASSTAPACGVTASYVTGCRFTGLGCSEQTADRTQACR